MEGEFLHSDDEDSDDDVEEIIHNAFLQVSPPNQGTAARRSKSWSDSSSSYGQNIDPHLLFKDGKSSSERSDSLSDVRPNVIDGNTSPSGESGTMSDARPKVAYGNASSSAESGAISDARPQDDLPSLGTSLHQSGDCRPCRFHYSIDGCRLERQCTFCHHPSHDTVPTGKSFRRPSKCVRKGLKKRMCEIAESSLSDDMKREAYIRLAGENAYVSSVLKKFHPDLFEGVDTKDIKEAARVARAASAVNTAPAAPQPNTAPDAPQPRVPGLQPEGGGGRVAPGELHEHLKMIEKAKNATKLSL